VEESNFPDAELMRKPRERLVK